MQKTFYLIVLFATITTGVAAQEQEPKLFGKLMDNISNLDTKLINKLDKQYQKTEERFTKQTSKWLKKLQKEETKLKKKLAKTDSLKAEQVFGDVKERYNKLQDQLKKKEGRVRQYIPALDSLGTATKFLQQQLAGTKLPSLPNITNPPSFNLPNTNTKLPSVTALGGTISNVQQKMQNATDIKKQIQQRKEQLKQQLQNTPIAKQLQGISKQGYYYQQQLTEYKELLNDPDKLTQKALGFVKDNAAFKDFFNKNSYLAQLFKIPENTSSGGVASINGLQTRASVMQSIQQRLGNVGGNTVGQNANPQNLLKDKLDAAKGELDKLKNKLNSGSSNVDDADMPNFKPNTQKTKSFLKRLEYGFNVQSQKSSTLLPTTSDIAATIGYKLNDKATIGIGAAYKLGWGNGWKDIQLSNQGIGCRSYVDMKFPQTKTAKNLWNFLTKNLWLSGGYEVNYLPELKEKLNNINPATIPIKVSSLGAGWQEAGLVGISKKMSIGKKKTTKMQFLWDFLSHKQTPHSETFKFRVGYEF